MREEQAVRGALLELMLSSVYAAKGCANSSAQGIKHCTHMQGSGLCDRWVYTWGLLSFMQAPGTCRQAGHKELCLCLSGVGMEVFHSVPTSSKGTAVVIVVTPHVDFHLLHLGEG